MARPAGKPGRYVARQLSRKVGAMLVCLCILAVACGFAFALALTTRSWLVGVLLVLGIVALLVLSMYLLHRIEKEGNRWKKGLDGELCVGLSLTEELPNTFWVIHDLTTEFGNLDHVVIGPTGVFAVETKNWRGLVTADGKGELLLNGKPTDKPYVKNLTRTIMDVKDRLGALVKTDRFIQGVIVFPSAYDNTKWGTTGGVHCISIESIPSYFVKHRVKTPLTTNQVDDIAQAFLALARRDKDFPGEGNA